MYFVTSMFVAPNVHMRIPVLVTNYKAACLQNRIDAVMNGW
jgi:hypothetical protein